MIKAIIFDLDDTLISEDEYIRSGYQYIGKLLEKKYQLSDASEELYQLYTESSKNVFNRYFEKHNIQYEKKDIIDLVQEYRNHKPKIHFFDDVIPTLLELRNRGFKLGIISDGYLETQRNKAEVLNLHQWFDKIIFTEELGREYWKPHPKAFEMMKEFFDVGFDEMMYIGDNPEKDFYIGSVYPVTTVRINRGDGVYQNKQYYKEVKENLIIEKVQDIL